MIINTYFVVHGLTFAYNYTAFITHWLSISYISNWLSISCKGSKILKKNFWRSHHRIFIKTFYTPVPPWLSISYVSNTTDRSFPGGYRHCQIVAVCRNLLKINHLHRLPKQSTLYNLYNYLKINQSCRTPFRISKRTPGPAGTPPGLSRSAATANPD